MMFFYEENQNQDLNESLNEQSQTETSSEQSVDLESKYLVETQALREQITRISADFENFKKRCEREKQTFFDIAKIDVINKLLPTLDDLLLAKQSVEKTDNSAAGMSEGITLVITNFEKSLKTLGVEEVQVQTFDPEIHEAIGQIEDPSKSSNDISVVIKKGFLINGKILRHAQVIVVK